MLQITVPILYAAAAFLLLRSANSGRVSDWPAPPVGMALGVVALLLHSSLLARAIFVDGTLALGLGNVIGLIGWLTAILALAGSAKPAMRGLTGILLVVAALMSLGTALPVATHFTRSMTWQLQAHVMMSMLAYSMIGIGAALALLIAAQDKRLRQRRPTGWLRVLPPMETLEQSLFGALTIGFLLLTLAVFSGLIFVEDFFAQHLVHKSVLSILAWLIFAILLAGRWRYGWRGKRAVHWTLVGFAILPLAYFGSKLVLEAMLGRQWG